MTYEKRLEELEIFRTGEGKTLRGFDNNLEIEKRLLYRIVINYFGISTGDRSSSNGLKLQQGRFRSEGELSNDVVKHLN